MNKILNFKIIFLFITLSVISNYTFANQDLSTQNIASSTQNKSRMDIIDEAPPIDSISKNNESIDSLKINESNNIESTNIDSDNSKKIPIAPFVVSTIGTIAFIILAIIF